MKGTIFKVLCESKTKTGNFYNIVGFYGLTSNASVIERKAQFQKIKESLSTDKINILMGEFNLNFVEDALDRNGKLPDNIVKDKQILGEWNDVKHDISKTLLELSTPYVGDILLLMLTKEADLESTGYT